MTTTPKSPDAATVTVSVSSHSSTDPERSGVSLRITDDSSRETVVDVTFTFEEFARVLMNQLTPGIEARFGVLARVGLVPFNITETFDSYKDEARAKSMARSLNERNDPLVRATISKTNDGKTHVTKTTYWSKR